MRTIRFRVTGPIDPVQALLKRISSIDDIDRVEEVADTGSHLREDSTSLNLPDDLGHTDFHDIEVHALSDTVDCLCVSLIHHRRRFRRVAKPLSGLQQLLDCGAHLDRCLRLLLHGRT